MYRGGGNNISVLGEMVPPDHPQPRKIYFEGSDYYGGAPNNNITKVAPGPLRPAPPIAAFQESQNGVIFEGVKPFIYMVRGMGILPIGLAEPGIFRITPTLMIYSVGVFVCIVGFIGYIKWDKVQFVRSSSTEGRFEEAVIDYLFTVYLVPVLLIPVAWYESRKLAIVFTEWLRFENIYKKITGRSLPLFVGNKPLLTSLALPFISSGTMVITHVTMVHFRILQVIPYCYINTITYIIGGLWYVQCDIIARVATIVANDFQRALRNVGPSSMVAEYRGLWMLLSKITKDVGTGSCYCLTFLCLYLFLVITLTIYGMLSQIQEGLGIKDLGLTITAVLAVALLFFICDEAHYASYCVKVNFQKKLLLVELSWMNDEAQQEINMFLRATEMNETNMSLGGFFDVNRNLFKSLLTTMVTYLVVLLQFQISLPESSSDFDDNQNITTLEYLTTFIPTTIKAITKKN